MRALHVLVCRLPAKHSLQLTHPWHCHTLRTTVAQAVQLVPALPTRLLPMLLHNMPHKLRDRSSQCLFMRAVLCLAEGRVGPALREGLLAGVVEHLLGIDADIKWEEVVDAPTGAALVEGPATLRAAGNLGWLLAAAANTHVGARAMRRACVRMCVARLHAPTAAPACTCRTC